MDRTLVRRVAALTLVTPLLGLSTSASGTPAHPPPTVGASAAGTPSTVGHAHVWGGLDRAATTPAPARPATGHAHLLSGPNRAVSTTAGKGLPRRPLPARSTTRIRLAGKSGIPKKDVSAIAVVLTASHPSGPTTLRAGRAKVPALVTRTHDKSASAFAILPLTSGRLTLHVGQHSTDVGIDVVGWFSSRSEKGNAGLFKQLSGRTLATLSIPANGVRTVQVLGHEDLPASHVAGALLRLRTSARKAGSLSIGPSKKATRTTVSDAYRKGAATDLTMVKPGKHGTITVRNTGEGPVSLTVQGAGWFTDGHDVTAYGDALSVAKTPRRTLRATVGPPGRDATICGVAGVPGPGSTSPASLVLGTVAAKSTNATGIVVDAAGTGSTGAVVIAAPRHGLEARQLLLAPGRDCATRVASTPSQAKVDLEVTAWFAGAVALSPQLRVLTSANLASITSVGPTSVTFAGPAASLPQLAAGNIIAAGTSSHTPSGLLRRVTGLTTNGRGFTVTTTDAHLGDAVLQGSITMGQADPAQAAQAARATQRITGRRARAGETECSIGDLGLLGATVGCSITYTKDANTVVVNAAAGMETSLDIDIKWGLPPKVHVKADQTLSTAAGLSVNASSQDLFDETYHLAEKIIGAQDFILGGVPIVIIDKLTADLHTTGTVQATLSGQAEVHASAGATFDSDTGLTPHHDFGKSGSASYSDDAVATLKVAFEPKIKAELYNSDSEYIGFGVTPYVEVTADACVVKAHSGVTLDIGLKITFAPGASIAKEFSISLFEALIFNEPWRNCAIWSGTMTFRMNTHDFDDMGRTVGNLNFSVNVVIKPPPENTPPPFQFYDATGSGSGAEIETEYLCPPDAGPATFTSTWGGSVHEANTATIGFPQGAEPGFQFVTSRFAGNIDGTYAISICGNTEQDARTHGSGFSLLPDPQGPSPTDQGGTDNMFIATPANQNSFSGTRTVDEVHANGGSGHMELEYSLQKTCLLGGSDC